MIKITKNFFNIVFELDKEKAGPLKQESKMVGGRSISQKPPSIHSYYKTTVGILDWLSKTRLGKAAKMLSKEQRVSEQVINDKRYYLSKADLKKFQEHLKKEYNLEETEKALPEAELELPQKLPEEYLDQLLKNWETAAAKTAGVTQSRFGGEPQRTRSETESEQVGDGGAGSLAGEEEEEDQDSGQEPSPQVASAGSFAAATAPLSSASPLSSTTVPVGKESNSDISDDHESLARKDLLEAGRKGEEIPPSELLKRDIQPRKEGLSSGKKVAMGFGFLVSLFLLVGSVFRRSGEETGTGVILKPHSFSTPEGEKVTTTLSESSQIPDVKQHDVKQHPVDLGNSDGATMSLSDTLKLDSEPEKQPMLQPKPLESLNEAAEEAKKQAQTAASRSQPEEDQTKAQRSKAEEAQSAVERAKVADAKKATRPKTVKEEGSSSTAWGLGALAALVGTVWWNFRGKGIKGKDLGGSSKVDLGPAGAFGPLPKELEGIEPLELFDGSEKPQAYESLPPYGRDPNNCGFGKKSDPEGAVKIGYDIYSHAAAAGGAKAVKIGIQTLANTGRTLGGLANTIENGRVITVNELSEYNTQEELVEILRLLAMCGDSKELQERYYDEFFNGRYGMKIGESEDGETIQGINYQKLEQNGKGNEGPDAFSRCYVSRGCRVAVSAATYDKNGVLKEKKVKGEMKPERHLTDQTYPLTCFCTGGPNAYPGRQGPEYRYSSVNRTYTPAFQPKSDEAVKAIAKERNLKVDGNGLPKDKMEEEAIRYEFFYTCMENAMRATLDAMAKEGITHAILGYLSCGLYAPKTKDPNSGKEYKIPYIRENFERILTKILNESVGPQGAKRGEYFASVVLADTKSHPKIKPRKQPVSASHSAQPALKNDGGPGSQQVPAQSQQVSSHQPPPHSQQPPHSTLGFPRPSPVSPADGGKALQLEPAQLAGDVFRLLFKNQLLVAKPGEIEFQGETYLVWVEPRKFAIVFRNIRDENSQNSTRFVTKNGVKDITIDGKPGTEDELFKKYGHLLEQIRAQNGIKHSPRECYYNNFKNLMKDKSVEIQRSIWEIEQRACALSEDLDKLHSDIYKFLKAPNPESRLEGLLQTLRDKGEVEIQPIPENLIQRPAGAAARELNSRMDFESPQQADRAHTQGGPASIQQPARNRWIDDSGSDQNRKATNIKAAIAPFSHSASSAEPAGVVPSGRAERQRAARNPEPPTFEEIQKFDPNNKQLVDQIWDYIGDSEMKYSTMEIMFTLNARDHLPLLQSEWNRRQEAKAQAAAAEEAAKAAAAKAQDERVPKVVLSKFDPNNPQHIKELKKYLNDPASLDDKIVQFVKLGNPPAIEWLFSQQFEGERKRIDRDSTIIIDGNANKRQSILYVAARERPEIAQLLIEKGATILSSSELGYRSVVNYSVDYFKHYRELIKKEEPPNDYGRYGVSTSEKYTLGADGKVSGESSVADAMRELISQGGIQLQGGIVVKFVEPPGGGIPSIQVQFDMQDADIQAVDRRFAFGFLGAEEPVDPNIWNRDKAVLTIPAADTDKFLRQYCKMKPYMVSPCFPKNAEENSPDNRAKDVLASLNVPYKAIKRGNNYQLVFLPRTTNEKNKLVDAIKKTLGQNSLETNPGWQQIIQGPPAAEEKGQASDSTWVVNLSSNESYQLLRFQELGGGNRPFAAFMARKILEAKFAATRRIDVHYTIKTPYADQLAAHEAAKTALKEDLSMIGAKVTFMHSDGTLKPPPMDEVILPGNGGEPLDSKVMVARVTSGVQHMIKENATKNDPHIRRAVAAASQGTATEARNVYMPPFEDDELPIYCNGGKCQMPGVMHEYGLDNTQGPKAQLQFDELQIKSLLRGAHLGFNGIIHILSENTKDAARCGYFMPQEHQMKELIRELTENGHKIEYVAVENKSIHGEKRMHLNLVFAPCFAKTNYGFAEIPFENFPQNLQEIELVQYLCAYHQTGAQLDYLLSLPDDVDETELSLTGVGLGVFGNRPEPVAKGVYAAITQRIEKLKAKKIQIVYDLLKDREGDAGKVADKHLNLQRVN